MKPSLPSPIAPPPPPLKKGLTMLFGIFFTAHVIKHELWNLKSSFICSFLAVNHNYDHVHKQRALKHRNMWDESKSTNLNLKPRPFELVQVKICFLRGLLSKDDGWQRKSQSLLIFKLRIRVFLFLTVLWREEGGLVPPFRDLHDPWHKWHFRDIHPDDRKTFLCW